MSEPQSEARRTPKGRSPSYPAIDLRAAIKRAETVYQFEKMHAAPIGAIVKHWGYKSHTSGIASTQYASLKKFGLLSEEGSGDTRQGKLTDLAYAILHNPHEDERLAAIQKAALAPPIHREMWNQYRNELPSDATLKYRLVTERGFTDAGAEDFVKQYKATIAFAMSNGGPAGEPIESEPDEVDEAEAFDRPPNAPLEPRFADPALRFQRSRQQMGGFTPEEQQLRNQLVHSNPLPGTRIPIPLVGGQQIVIEGEFPITEAAWANFLSVLQAFKPGLVVPNAPIAAAPTPAEFMQFDQYRDDEEDSGENDNFEPPF